MASGEGTGEQRVKRRDFIGSKAHLRKDQDLNGGAGGARKGKQKPKLHLGRQGSVNTEYSLNPGRQGVQWKGDLALRWLLSHLCEENTQNHHLPVSSSSTIVRCLPEK